VNVRASVLSIAVLALVACGGAGRRAETSVAPATAGAGPRTILMRGERLAESKRLLAQGDTSLKATLAVLIDSAGQLGTTNSSRRFKEDIADMDEASAALMRLRPVTFRYKSDTNTSHRRLQYGLVAEEVAAVYPGLVAHSADGEVETVMYQYLPAMLLNEYQKQQRTIQTQVARIAELEKQAEEIAILKAKTEWLVKALDRLTTNAIRTAAADQH